MKAIGFSARKMKLSLKIAIVVIAVIVAIPVIILVAAEVIVNSNVIKAEIENIVSEALEMDFKIEGRIDIRFLPSINLAVNDLNVGIKTGRIASADRIIIDPLLLPLWKGDVQIKEARIHRARLALDVHAIDKITALINTESKAPLPVESLAIESFAISDAGFNYDDGQTLIDFYKINFRGNRVEIIKNREVIIDDIYQFLKGISFRGNVAARQISSRGFKLENLSAKLKNENGILTTDPVTLQYLGSESKLSARLDLRQAKANFKSQITLSALNLKALSANYFPAIKLRGKVDCTAEFSAADIQMELLPDYLSPSGNSAARKKIPIKSVWLEKFTVTATDLKYSNNTINIDKAKLNFKGDRWALIENNHRALSGFDGFLRATKLVGNASIKRLTVPDQLFENIQADFTNNHGVFNSDPIKLEYFGERAEIGLNWNLKEKTEQIELRVEIPALDTKRLLKKSDDVDLLDGILNIKAEFRSSGADRSEIVKNIDGRVILQGADLTLHGVDFDKALDEFQKMDGYGLNDFAAMITLGPLGTVVTQGYGQLESLEKMMAAKGNSRIQQIVSNWNVIKGVAQASDVAFSTARHRVAIAGKLDFPNKRFVDVTIAVVDHGGCIVNKEIIDGSFDKSVVKEMGVIQRTVIRPFKKFLTPGCESFYKGSVPHPSTAPGK